MLRTLSYRALNLVHRQRARAAGAVVADSVLFIGRPRLSRAVDSTISIGSGCVFTSTSSATALGVNHEVILRTLLPGAVLAIGRDVGMSGGVICAAGRVEIGDGCLLGANVTIADTDFHELYSRKRRYAGFPAAQAEDAVTVGRNVFLGTGCIILKGVTIGDDCVVGAGAVVTRSIPAGSVCAGSPARVLSNWVEAAP